MDNIKSIVRKNILDLKSYTSARSQHLNGILLDANENSLGSVIEDDRLGLNRYPDPSQSKLREEIGKYLNINSNNIFCGVGSDEIIDLLIRIFCEPGNDSVAIFEPTYGMYKVVCDIQGVEVNSHELDSNFQVNVEEFISTKSDNCKIAFVCSPNNPTANVINKNEIIKLAQEFNGIVVVDQAYIDFYDERQLLEEAANFNNLVLLRTFSKAWGMAGARFGFSVTSSEIVEFLMSIKSPYNINKLTEDAVIKALKRTKTKNEFLDQIKEERSFLVSELKKIDKIEKVFDSDANFILFKVSDADSTYNRLAEKNIIVRNRSNQKNLSGCLRVTIGTHTENVEFLKILQKVL